MHPDDKPEAARKRLEKLKRALPDELYNLHLSVPKKQCLLSVSTLCELLLLSNDASSRCSLHIPSEMLIIPVGGPAD